jgi:hypothetical protein
VDTGARAFDTVTVLAQQDRMAQQLLDNAQTTAASIAGLSTVLSASTRHQGAINRLESLKAEHRSLAMMTIMAPPDKAASLNPLFQGLENSIAARLPIAERAQDTLFAAERFSLPSSLPPCPPSPLFPLLPSFLAPAREKTLAPTPLLMTTASVYALTQARVKLANSALPPPLTSIRYFLSLLILPPPFTLPPLPQNI